MIPKVFALTVLGLFGRIQSFKSDIMVTLLNFSALCIPHIQVINLCYISFKTLGILVQIYYL